MAQYSTQAVASLASLSPSSVLLFVSSGSSRSSIPSRLLMLTSPSSLALCVAGRAEHPLLCEAGAHSLSPREWHHVCQGRRPGEHWDRGLWERLESEAQHQLQGREFPKPRGWENTEEPPKGQGRRKTWGCGGTWDPGQLREWLFNRTAHPGLLSHGAAGAPCSRLAGAQQHLPPPTPHRPMKTRG